MVIYSPGVRFKQSMVFPPFSFGGAVFLPPAGKPLLAAMAICHRHNVVNPRRGELRRLCGSPQASFRRAHTPSRFPLNGPENAERNKTFYFASLSVLRNRNHGLSPAFRPALSRRNPLHSVSACGENRAPLLCLSSPRKICDFVGAPKELIC